MKDKKYTTAQKIKRVERAIGELYLRINRLEKLQEENDKRFNVKEKMWTEYIYNKYGLQEW